VQTGEAHIPQHRRVPAPEQAAVVDAVVPDSADLVHSANGGGMNGSNHN
jgi:hypothetical protein